MGYTVTGKISRGQECGEHAPSSPSWVQTYNKPIRKLFVDIDDALKAGHVVEPDNEMQLCARAVGAVASIESNAVVFFSPWLLRLLVLDRSAWFFAGGDDSSTDVKS